MIDITNYEAFKGGEKLSLTLKEFELLKVLVLSRGKVLTRDFLLDRIWGYEYYGETPYRGRAYPSPPPEAG